MKCAGCGRELEQGDHFISDKASGFASLEADPEFDNIISDLLGGPDGRVVFCEGCTQEGGDYELETYDEG
jgi:hypothetical protein